MNNLITIIYLAVLLPLGTNASDNNLRTRDKRMESKNNRGQRLSYLHAKGRRWRAEKPTMHTFFHTMEGHHKGTGMTDDDDLLLLAAWEDAWHSAGWNTRIIGMKEAMEHPDFEKYMDRLVGARKEDGGKLIGYYDKLCFIRWLAMAQVGGGWMSDYDTFPLRQKPIYKIPNNGHLTLYDKQANGNAVPSLISGSKEAYNNMAFRLLDVVGGRVNTDMYALEHLKSEFIIDQRVMKGRVAFTYWREPSADCDVILSETWAIHFSHSNMNKARRAGLIPSKSNVGDRGLFAPMVIKNLSKRCYVSYLKRKQEKKQLY